MIEMILFPLALVVGLPALSLLILTLSAGRRQVPMVRDVPVVDMRVAVLVPAHNESTQVLPTIACLLPQLRSADRLVVIADNCTDDTAKLARQAGAEVIERHAEQLRGKGYALDFGVNYLRADPPDIVVIVDADCIVSEQGVQRVALDAWLFEKPVQMLNLMHAPQGGGVRPRMLEFAWRVKNWVRPLGAFKLGRVCHLMGTGMALPWSLVAKVPLATGHVTEDMKLGVDLAIAGSPARLCLEAQIHSQFPLDSDVAKVQKSRWEHGHLQTLTQELPRLFMAWLKQPQKSLAILTMDLLIPPLAFYVLLLGGLTVLLTLLNSVLDVGNAVIWILWASLFQLGIAVGLSWWRFGRDLLKGHELMTAPAYALWKLPLYLAYFARRRTGWVRTRRDAEQH